MQPPGHKLMCFRADALARLPTARSFTAELLFIQLAWFVARRNASFMPSLSSGGPGGSNSLLEVRPRFWLHDKRLEPRSWQGLE